MIVADRGGEGEREREQKKRESEIGTSGSAGLSGAGGRE
jgi:hypothetical protein